MQMGECVVRGSRPLIGLGSIGSGKRLAVRQQRKLRHDNVAGFPDAQSRPMTSTPTIRRGCAGAALIPSMQIVRSLGRTIIVETANRFARDLMVQEVGHAKLRMASPMND
jgi:hypothetical protein